MWLSQCRGNIDFERMFSRLTLLEYPHPKTHAITLDAVFNYHMRAPTREMERKHTIMRAETKGVARGARERLPRNTGRSPAAAVAAW
eukprot:6200433-Pleurochrysis_carterae.AAC.1